MVNDQIVARGLFGTHVPPRTHNGTTGSNRRSQFQTGQTEVRNIDAAGFIQQQVAGLDVPVHDAVLVSIRKSFGDLPSPTSQGATIRRTRRAMIVEDRRCELPQPTSVLTNAVTLGVRVFRRLVGTEQLQHLRQRRASDVLHRIVVDAAFRAGRVSRHNVGMFQRGGGTCFVVEACQLLAVGQGCQRQHFQGDDPIQRPLPGAVYDSHAAPADLFQDVVIAQRG